MDVVFKSLRYRETQKAGNEMAVLYSVKEELNSMKMSKKDKEEIDWGILLLLNQTQGMYQ